MTSAAPGTPEASTRTTTTVAGPAGHDTGLDVVTGAFSYSGAVIARRLLHAGRRVRTPTGHPERAGETNQILVERALAESDLVYAVLRPSVLFDERGVLLNHMAWLLRRLPVFAVEDRPSILEPS
jgi:uncharacterized protein YbjT (DUF2867 family)